MLNNQSLRGIIYMLLAGITFVSCDSFLKLMLREVPPLQSLVLRGCSAAVWCFALLTVTGQLKELPKAIDFWTFMRAVAEVFAVTCFIIALASVPLADITAIYQVAPLLVLAGASFLWGEHVGPLRWLLIGLGLAGALLVAQPGGSGTSPLALLGFGTAFGSAVRDLLARKAPKNAPGFVMTFSIIIAVLVAALIGNQLFEAWVPVSRNTFLYSIGSGFFVMLGHFFVLQSFRHTSARTVAPFYYAFTMIAVLYGVVFFGEVPNALAIAGICLIVASGLGVLYFERGAKTP